MSGQPLKCFVAGCSNSSLANKKSEKQISFHRFPRDPRLRDTWTKNCGIDKNCNLGRISICSEHFVPSAFLHYQKGPKSNHGAIVKLVRGAVPTLNLPRDNFEHPQSIRIKSRENELMPDLSEKEDASSLSGSDEYCDRENDVIILEITSIAGKHQSTKVIEPSAKRRKTCKTLQNIFDSDKDSSNDELDNEPDPVSKSFHPNVSENDDQEISDPDGGTVVKTERSVRNSMRRESFFLDHGESSSSASDNAGQRLEWDVENETDCSEKTMNPPIVLPTNPLPVLVKQGNVKRMMLLRSSPVPQHTAAKPMPVLVNQGNTSQLMYLQDIPPQPNSQSASSREVLSVERVLQKGEGGSAMDSVAELDDRDDCPQLNEESTMYVPPVSSSKLIPLTAPSSSGYHKYDISQLKNARSTSPAFVSSDKALIDRLHKRIQQMEDKMKVQTELYKKRLHAANLKHRLKVVQLNERIQALQYQLHDVPEVFRKGADLGNDSKTVQNNKTRKAISLDVWKLLNKTFTDNEIKAICDKERQIRWKDSELLKAYTLRCLSYGAYVFVRDKLKYPLPSTKYLTRWLTGIQKKKELIDNECGVQEELIDEEDLQGFDEEIYIETVDNIDEVLNSDEN